MKFENLPNELFYDLFEFLSIIDRFHSFHNLNNHLNNLLYYNKQKSHLNFQSISKYDLTFICQNYLPFIINQINSLYLSDDDKTPFLSEFLFSSGFTLNQFNYLQNLILNRIYCLNQIFEIIPQCYYLTHLTIIKCFCGQHHEKDFQFIINSIWNLSKLIYFKLDDNLPGHRLLIYISNKSYSIKYLSIKNIHCDFQTLSHLFEYTPNLQQLYTTIFCGSRDEQLNSFNWSIISLNIIQKSSLNTMINLFQHLINLSTLIIETNYVYLDGYKWESILLKYLPNIKNFRLKMRFELSTQMSREEQIDLLLDSFRTSFWIEKYQWFVQCDWSLSKLHPYAVLYTLPHIFHDFLYDNLCQSKSTLLKHRNSYSYNYVKSLQYVEYENQLIKHSYSSSIQFLNIQHLYITLPYDNHFWLRIPTLNQLKTLDVRLNNNLGYYYLQNLLNRTTKLYSLTFRCLQNISLKLFHLINPSIRRLDFLSMSTLPNEHFNNFECHLLSTSSLGQQCNILLIKVQNRLNILQLIENMFNLRTLIIQCEDDNSTNDELIQWLYEHLPSTYSIKRDFDEPSKIRLWID